MASLKSKVAKLSNKSNTITNRNRATGNHTNISVESDNVVITMDEKPEKKTSNNGDVVVAVSATATASGVLTKASKKDSESGKSKKKPLNRHFGRSILKMLILTIGAAKRVPRTRFALLLYIVFVVVFSVVYFELAIPYEETIKSGSLLYENAKELTWSTYEKRLNTKPLDPTVKPDEDDENLVKKSDRFDDDRPDDQAPEPVKTSPKTAEMEVDKYKEELKELKLAIQQKDERIADLERVNAVYSTERPVPPREDGVYKQIKADLATILYLEINEYLKSCDLNVTFTVDDIKSSAAGFQTVAVDFWNIMYDDLKLKLRMDTTNTPYKTWFEKRDPNAAAAAQIDIYDALKKKSVDVMLEHLMSKHAEYRCCCKYGTNSKYSCGQAVTNEPAEKTTSYGMLDALSKPRPTQRTSESEEPTPLFWHYKKNAQEFEQKPQCLITHTKFQGKDDFLYNTRRGNSPESAEKTEGGVYLNVGLDEKFFNMSLRGNNRAIKKFDPYLLSCKVSFVMLQR